MSDDLSALADRFGLGADEIRRLRSLLVLVRDDPEAPTTIRAETSIIKDHFADSLVALAIPEVTSAGRIVDVGSGAGFPGIPLAIALPAAHLTLLEANGRKCRFLRRACETCEIENAEVVQARAESLPPSRGGADVVTARALARLDVVSEYAAPLLRVGGMLVAWRGSPSAGEDAAAALAAGVLGLELKSPLRVSPYPEAQNRHLQQVLKLTPTPPRFPRRPGVAGKRPLGGPIQTSR